jgi:hypothetical protein
MNHLYQTILRRCQKGTELLDRVLKPQWAKRIDLDRLSLINGSSCVLGQLYGHYTVGCEKLFGEQPGHTTLAIEHGFEMDYDYPFEGDYLAELKENWRVIIENHQAD